jgi:hypothetical protein
MACLLVIDTDYYAWTTLHSDTLRPFETEQGHQPPGRRGHEGV